jgi:hypothetical protein
MDNENKPKAGQVVKKLIAEDGWKGLYRGLGPRFFSSSAWGTSMIVCYEYLSMFRLLLSNVYLCYEYLSMFHLLSNVYCVPGYQMIFARICGGVWYHNSCKLIFTYRNSSQLEFSLYGVIQINCHLQCIALVSSTINLTCDKKIN